jgi:hypothetical protein
MTSDPDPRDETGDEASLKRLFDSSAAELSGPTLTKLRARAREVPERTARAPRWLPRWAWSPLIAGFAVGTGALAVAIGVWVRSPDSTSPVPVAAPDTSAAQPGNLAPPAPFAASPSAATPNVDHLAADDLSDDDPFLDENAELAADFDLDVDQSYLDFDPLDSPADDDLDAWWEATADLIEGGG